MEIGIENVTPTKAMAWLNLNKSNRKMREGVAEKYAADMSAGRWTSCPTPISFYDDGDVADGQHRLWAIVESGVAQKFPVARGLKREDGLNIDTGFGRTLVDAGRISGRDTGLSTTLLAVARAVAEGSCAKGTPSNAQRLAWVAEHREASTWAASNGPKAKYLRNTVVLTSIARAWYYETDLSRLKRFCDVVNSGFYDGDGESAAVALRNYLLQKEAVSSSAAMWGDTFLKVQNAIAYFMKGKKLTVIRGVADEAYPLKKKGGRK